MIETDSRVPRRLSFIWKRCGASTLIVTPAGERVLLNPEASRIWELIDDRRPVSSIKELVSQSNGDPLTNVNRVLESMFQARVLTYDSFLWARE